MSAITVGGELIHYEVLGRGRQVVLIHGWIGSWRYWIPTMQQLQAKYRVYALDLYGFGDSSKNPEKYTLEHQLELLADFMRELGMPKAALVGHGLGALIAAEYARRYPDAVARLVLASGPLFDPGDLDRRVPAGRKVLLTQNRGGIIEGGYEPNPNAPTLMSASAAMRQALIEAARARANGEVRPGDETVDRAEYANTPNHNPLLNLLADPEIMLARAFRRNEPEYDKLHVDVVKTDPRVLRETITGYDSGRMLDTLRLLPMPTLAVHGTDDPIIPVPSDPIWNYVTVDRDGLLLPIPLPGVRHFPMLEHDRFFKLINDFLEAPDLTKLEIKELWRRRTR